MIYAVRSEVRMARRPKPELRVDPWSARRDGSRGLDKTGRPSWRCWATHPDTGKTVTRRRRGTQGEIKRWLATLDPTSKRVKASKGTTAELRTVGDLLRARLAALELADKPVTSIGTRRSEARRIRKTPLWHVALSELSVVHLEQYAHLRRHDGRMWSTIKQELLGVTAAWTWAQKRAYLSPKPLYMPELPTEDKDGTNRKTPSAGEVATVVAWLESPACSVQWPGPMLRLQWALGCRSGTLVKLEWTDVDLERGLVTLTGKRKTRVVPIPPAALRVFRAAKATPPNEGTRAKKDPARVLGIRATTASFRWWVLQACAAQGVEDFPPQGVRRSMDDRLAEKQVSPAVLAKVQGHSAIVSVENYQTPRRETLASAMGDGELPRGEVRNLPNSKSGQESRGGANG